MIKCDIFSLTKKKRKKFEYRILNSRDTLVFFQKILFHFFFVCMYLKCEEFSTGLGMLEDWGVKVEDPQAEFDLFDGNDGGQVSI